ADRRAGGELLRILVTADDDATADRHALEREPRSRERRLLGRLVVGPAEPPRARDRRALRHPRERLALALRPRRLGGLLLHRGLLELRHTGSRVRSAALITSRITSSIDRSTFAFSTTGTPSRRARPDR